MAQKLSGSVFMIRDRFQWLSYGFIPGLVTGVILGWLFHGVVGTILRFVLVALLLVPFVVAFIVWRRLADKRGRDDALESRSFVVETRTDEREGR